MTRIVRSWFMLGVGLVVWPATGMAGTDQDQTLAAIQEDLRANPHNTHALFMLALHYESRRDTAAALSAWREFLANATKPEERAIAEKHIHHLSQ